MINIKRTSFLNIPVDIVDTDAAFSVIEDLLQDGGKHQIVLLTVDKLLKARMNEEYNKCIRQSSLILPVSKGIVKGMRFHNKGNPSRFNPYDFIVRLLILVEKLKKSIYIIGSHKNELQEAEKSLKVSFPDLKIIGRFVGYFNKEMEKNVVLAIKKSSPALVLAGKGLPGKEKWIFRNKKLFNPGVYLWVDNHIEIFSRKEQRTSKKLFKIGLESMAGFYKKPWKIFRIFIFLYFKFLVLVHKIGNR